jgi:SH3 domain-containing YSC84-like protein 1
LNKKHLRNILNLEMLMNKTIFFILIFSFCSTSALAKEDHDQTLRDSLSVIDEIMNSPDQEIPGDLISEAKAILIFPTLIKAGFFVGGRYGNGVASMRTKKSGAFGPPAFLTQAGLSFGFQVGAEAVDLILLVMTQRGLESLLKDKLTLGADVAVSAGPFGRHAEAATDIRMQGEIYSYSRSKGAFAGVSLKGTVITTDEGAHFDYYGRFFKAKDILIKGRVKMIPESGRQFIKRLNFLAPSKKK